MFALALSGWAQSPESLDDVLPDDAVRVAYGDVNAVDVVFQRMVDAVAGRSLDVAVGWSLGGQLLVRAIAAGLLKPERLVLLGAPFQLLSNSSFPKGKSPAMVAASRLALMANPMLMLEEFQTRFLTMGDDQAATIRAVSPGFMVSSREHWLFWYDELSRFSAHDLDFSRFPPTDIIHGREDFVIPFANAEAYAARIPMAKLHALDHCGHAPHWHDASFVRRVITGE